MPARKLLILLIAVSLAGGGAAASRPPREVVRCPSSGLTLAARLDWGLKEASVREYTAGYWGGYSIRRLMGEHSSIGSFNCGTADEPTLEEILTGKRKEFPALTTQQTARRALAEMSGKHELEAKVWKEVAILFRFDKGKQRVVSRVDMSNLDLSFDFEGLPLLWLGGAEEGESLAWLKSVFAASPTEKVKKEILAAVGIHQSPALVLPILGAVLRGRESVHVRKDAAFWIGEQPDPKACEILLAAARSDPSLEVRKHAVFALSQVDLEASVDGLIALARGADSVEVRKEAVFWLSEKASKKALATLTELAERDPETKVQEQALFALSEFHDPEALTALIRVAKTHPNPQVRKRAIFLLGDSGDPRAVDALVAIIKKS